MPRIRRSSEIHSAEADPFRHRRKDDAHIDANVIRSTARPWLAGQCLRYELPKPSPIPQWSPDIRLCAGGAAANATRSGPSLRLGSSDAPTNGRTVELVTFRPHPTVPRHKTNAVRRQLWETGCPAPQHHPM